MSEEEIITTPNFIGMLMEIEQNAKEAIRKSDSLGFELETSILGPKSDFAQLAKKIRFVPASDRSQVGTVLNEVKQSILSALADKNQKATETPKVWRDVTEPGILPPTGHLHIVTQAIMEITRIFERIGFTRVRHPEADWDWYAFESLNMPKNHPARDEWETFFINYPGKPSSHSGGRRPIESTEILSSRMPGLQDDHKNGQIVLTPHTSNGQVREMEKGKLPIRMINIAKCYRRQSDVSHVPMFYQFEGLYVDHDVSIAHLKGVLTYFFQQFYGTERKVRLRPFHFQFTEPSFEIDVSCGVCGGTGFIERPHLDFQPITVVQGKALRQFQQGSIEKIQCKICKSGWLELGGAGMVHPNVLKNGGIDTAVYSGFAFGWGVERTYMMKGGTQLDDVRLIYSNDIRFLEQF